MTWAPGRSDGADLVAGLLRAVRATGRAADIPLIVRAFEAAEHWHRGQLRKNGEPYITHPVAVAEILAGMGADDPTLCAGLLHDVIESTACTQETLRAEFGGQIADLVRGAGTLDLADYLAGASAGGEPLAGDGRILLIKVADRLHNMRTIGPLPPASQVERSLQTLQVQVPMARALGADAVGAELADLASATLRRHHRLPPTATGRVLCVSAALLPASARSRWREEWLAEVDQLQTRCARARFTAQILLGLGRLTVAVRGRITRRPG